MATKEVTVPTATELDATEDKIASYLSDLDAFVSELQAREREERSDDIEQLARVIVFAVDQAEAADQVRELAEALRTQALVCFHGAQDHG